jgi:hypothetical protein
MYIPNALRACIKSLKMAVQILRMSSSLPLWASQILPKFRSGPMAYPRHGPPVGRLAKAQYALIAGYIPPPIHVLKRLQHNRSGSVPRRGKWGEADRNCLTPLVRMVVLMLVLLFALLSSQDLFYFYKKKSQRKKNENIN